VVRALMLAAAPTADCAPWRHADPASWRASVAALVPRKWAPAVLHAKCLVVGGCLTWGTLLEDLEDEDEGPGTP
jgi:hypothetical protein